MKKTKILTKLLVLITLLFVIPTTSMAVSVKLVDPLDPNESQEGTALIRTIISNVVEWIRNISLGLAVLMVVIAGAIYLTSAGSERKTYASKMITGVAIGLLVIFSAASLIIEVLSTIGADTSEAESQLGSDTQTFEELATRIANVLGGLIGIIGVFALLVGGAVYMTAAGNEERMELGKNIIKYSIFGIGIALLAWSIVNFLTTIIS